MLTSVWRWLFPIRSFDLELTADVPSTVASLRARVLPRGIRTMVKSGVVGRVDASGVSLRYQNPWMRNGYAPAFEGRFAEVGGRMCLAGQFRMSGWTRGSFAFWCGFILLWWVIAVTVTIESPGPGLSLPMVILLPPSLIGFGVGMIRGFGGLAKANIPQMEAVLRDAVSSAVPRA
ncbi:MAG: hypothetical protein ABI446_12825 [Gemmatimonadaceae bacterium]